VLVGGGGQRIFDAATDPIGNGRAMSILFAREGARVPVADRNATSAAETVARIRDGGGHALAIEPDITREADVVHGAGGLQDVRARKVNGVRTERADGERWSSRRTTS